MANMLENYGLTAFAEDEELLMGLIAYVAEQGKAVAGYYGSPYLFHPMGDIEFWIRTEKRPEGGFTATGFDTHCGGHCVWDMIHTGIDITPKDESKLTRTIMFQRKDAQGGILPISLVGADILPGFLKGDEIAMQLVALPLQINYYENEDTYAEAQPEDENGKKWLIAKGSMVALDFLYNHTPGKYEPQKDYETDCYVQFVATVKALYHGTFELNGETHRTFIRCVAETEYGELEFDHSIDQVPHELRANIKEGAIISGVCILSGDVAIKEYSNGIIQDFDHNLRLLRYTLENGEAERLTNALAEDAVYETDTFGERYCGRKEIVDRFAYVHKNRKEKYTTHLATITQAEGMEFPIGTRCIVLTSGEEENYESIAFMTLGSDGKILRIKVSTDRRYRFEIDRFPRQEKPVEQYKIPNHVIEPILLRAKFLGIVEDHVDETAVLEGIENHTTLEQNARGMLEALQEYPQENVELALENIFGYLFAKAIEQTFNENLPNPEFKTRLTASYRPAEAFVGMISSTLDGSKHAVLEKAMRLAKHFYTDFKMFVRLTEAKEEDFVALFKHAAIVVQRLGQMYSKRCFDNE